MSIYENKIHTKNKQPYSITCTVFSCQIVNFFLFNFHHCFKTMINVVIITQSFSCVTVQFLVLHTIAEIISYLPTVPEWPGQSRKNGSCPAGVPARHLSRNFAFRVATYLVCPGNKDDKTKSGLCIY